MIDITYYRDYNRVTVRGHAGTAPEGHDLVCAAVSAITGTLAANMEQLAQNGAVRAPCIRLSKGDAEIGGTPRHGYKSLVQMVASSICVGFELLAEKYPEAVSYSIHG